MYNYIFCVTLSVFHQVQQRQILLQAAVAGNFNFPAGKFPLDDCSENLHLKSYCLQSWIHVLVQLTM